LLKNIRNNWITEKTQKLEFFVDKEKKTARWADIEALHDLEKNKIIKLSKLTEVTVYPNPIERQNVRTCLQVFSDETLSALKTHPELKNNDGTIYFLSRFIEFWKIVSVHGPYADIRMRDPNRAVIRSPVDDNLVKLRVMANLAEQMAHGTGERVKCLTKDTARCFPQTCSGIIDAACFLLISHHEYVTFGNFTSDPLEKQFGKLRQGSGGTYSITVQQMFEKVAISRTKRLLKLNDGANVLNNLESSHSCLKCKFLPDHNLCNVIENLPVLEKSLSVDVKMALVYIAGYIIRKDDEDLK
jgi:hypothetical protein